MNVKSHGEIKIEDLFSGNSASMSTAGSIMAPLTFLLDNDFEPIQIEAVDLTIQSTEQPRTATIERVWLDGVRARAGRTVPLKVLMRTLSRRGSRAHGAAGDSGQRDAARCR